MDHELNSPESSDNDNDNEKESRITSVDLGFVESEPDDDAFSPHVFPSKIGGKPVWLDPRSVIGSDTAICEICSGPMVLLTQVYCPLPNREEDAYHRTIYVFMCPRRECCTRNSNKNFAVFRSQLSKENPIYAFDNAPEEVKLSYKYCYESALSQLCSVCGLNGPFRCSRCKSVTYCSRQHQTHDWHGGHKSLCNQPQDKEKESAEKPASSSDLTLHEFELCIEPEPACDKDQEKSEGENLPTSLTDFANEQTAVEEEDANLESQITAKKDPAFSRFLRRIKRRPSQVVRYELGASPLWPSSANRPESLPNCDLCNSPRQFEFQIMPQLLTYLRLDESIVGANGVDWATLAIYTCSTNCKTVTSNNKPCCVREFLWKQDYSE